MKNIVSVLALIMLFSPSVEAESDLTQKVRTFLESYVLGDFKKASKQIYCPKQYADKKAIEEQEQLENELARMAKSYGKAKSYKQVQSSMYSTVMLGCGAPQDHESTQPIGMDMVEVEYEENKRGIIQLFYLSTKLGPVFGLVGIGEPSMSPSSIRNQYNLYKELKNSPNKAN